MKKKQKQFARRFSLDDWLVLSNNTEFEIAFSKGEFDLCEVLAAKILY